MRRGQSVLQPASARTGQLRQNARKIGLILRAKVLGLEQQHDLRRQKRRAAEVLTSEFTARTGHARIAPIDPVVLGSVAQKNIELEVVSAGSNLMDGRVQVLSPPGHVDAGLRPRQDFA